MVHVTSMLIGYGSCYLNVNWLADFSVRRQLPSRREGGNSWEKKCHLGKTAHKVVTESEGLSLPIS